MFPNVFNRKRDGKVFVINSLVEFLFFIYATNLKDKYNVNFQESNPIGGSKYFFQVRYSAES